MNHGAASTRMLLIYLSPKSVESSQAKQCLEAMRILLVLVSVLALLIKNDAGARTRTEIVQDTSCMYSDDGKVLVSRILTESVRPDPSDYSFV